MDAEEFKNANQMSISWDYRDSWAVINQVFVNVV